MKIKADKITSTILVLAMLLSLVFLWRSVSTLDRFPWINSDEVDNAHTALHCARTGEIYSTLMHDLVDPKFRDLNSVDPGSLRGVYLRILGPVEKMTGVNALRLRAFSISVSLVSAAVFLLIGGSVSGLTAGILAAVFWLWSPDVVSASHLIRPDIILGLFFVGVLALLVPPFRRNRHWRTLGAAALAAASVGLHPHGLVLVAVTFTFLVTDLITQDAQRSEALFYFLGLLLGGLVFAAAADWPSFALSQHTYIQEVFRTNSAAWWVRLSPWETLKSFVTLLIRPQSYYVDADALKHFPGAMSAVLILAVLVWPHRVEKQKRTVRLLRLGLIVTMAALGFARLRSEFIYLLPVTVFVSLLSGLFLAESLKNIKIDRREAVKSAAFLVLPAILILSSWEMLGGGPSFESRWDQVRVLVGANPGRVAGPSDLWFVYADNFRSVDALALNRIYSGDIELRPSFQRFRPDHLIIDESFIRRALAKKKSDGKLEISPVEVALGVPAQLLGVVPPEAGRSALVVYRLNWTGRVPR